MIRGMLRIILFVLIPVVSLAAEPAVITAVRVQASASVSHIDFVLNKNTYGKVKYTPNDKTIIVEFSNASKSADIKNAKIQGSNIAAISTSSNQYNDLQFIIRIKNKIKWKINFSSNKKRESVLKLTITSLDDATQTKATPSVKKNKPEASKKETAKPKPAMMVVVIDAGHGGKDAGAIGPRGKKEKDVVLAISTRLASLVNAEPGMRAVLTRKGDYYVPLRSRLKLARKGDADLFIAVHADAFFNKKARGASVYALSHRGATSEAARWLAKKENYSELSDIELNTLQDRSPMLRSVLIDLAQTATIHDSLKLGNKMLEALDAISLVRYKRVEQAPFVVLKSPDIPSILIETGFITNPYEEKQLASPYYQKKMAKAIFDGLKKYKHSYFM